MAGLELNGFDRFDEALKKMDMYDTVAPKLLNGSIGILENNLKKEVEKHKKTGQLHKSIRSKKAMKNKYGWYATAAPQGTDSNGVRNMEKLAYLEYGTSNQPATPCIAPSVNRSLSAVEERMQQIFNESVGEL